MKKTLIALLALAGIAAAGTEETITLQPAPQTACTLKPEFGIEYLYGHSDCSDEMDTQGIRASIGTTLNTNSAFSHTFSLNLGYDWGDKADIVKGNSANLEENKTTITLGYDLNYALTDKVTLYVGAKAGYATGEIEFSRPARNFAVKDDLEGFTYSVGGGVKYQITENVHLKAGYEFNRSYLGHFGPNKEENYIPCLHVFSVGVGYKF